MIVDDFDIERIAAVPGETNAPLIVDPDTHLPLPIAPQLFQPIAGRIAQIVET